MIAAGTSLEDLAATGRLATDGNQTKLAEVLSLLDPPDPNFAIVSPGRQ